MSAEAGNLWAAVDYVNASKGHIVGEEPAHETAYSDRGELYRRLGAGVWQYWLEA